MLSTFIKGCCIGLLALSSLMATAKSADKTELFAVMYYADWCGACKKLDPKLEQAITEYDLNNENVLFVKLDLTDEATTNQSEMLVKALGLQSSYGEYQGKTGFALLVDADTKQVMSRLTMFMSPKQLAQQVKASIAKASS